MVIWLKHSIVRYLLLLVFFCLVVRSAVAQTQTIPFGDNVDGSITLPTATKIKDRAQEAVPVGDSPHVMQRLVTAYLSHNDSTITIKGFRRWELDISGARKSLNKVDERRVLFDIIDEIKSDAPETVVQKSPSTTTVSGKLFSHSELRIVGGAFIEHFVAVVDDVIYVFIVAYPAELRSEAGPIVEKVISGVRFGSRVAMQPRVEPQLSLTDLETFGSIFGEVFTLPPGWVRIAEEGVTNEGQFGEHRLERTVLAQLRPPLPSASILLSRSVFLNRKPDSVPTLSLSEQLDFASRMQDQTIRDIKHKWVEIDGQSVLITSGTMNLSQVEMAVFMFSFCTGNRVYRLVGSTELTKKMDLGKELLAFIRLWKIPPTIVRSPPIVDQAASGNTIASGAVPAMEQTSSISLSEPLRKKLIDWAGLIMFVAAVSAGIAAIFIARQKSKKGHAAFSPGPKGGAGLRFMFLWAIAAGVVFQLIVGGNRPVINWAAWAGGVIGIGIAFFVLGGVGEIIGRLVGVKQKNTSRVVYVLTGSAFIVLSLIGNMRNSH